MHVVFERVYKIKEIYIEIPNIYCNNSWWFHYTNVYVIDILRQILGKHVCRCISEIGWDVLWEPLLNKSLAGWSFGAQFWQQMNSQLGGPEDFSTNLIMFKMSLRDRVFCTVNARPTKISKRQSVQCQGWSLPWGTNPSAKQLLEHSFYYRRLNNLIKSWRSMEKGTTH